MTCTKQRDRQRRQPPAASRLRRVIALNMRPVDVLDGPGHQPDGGGHPHEKRHPAGQMAGGARLLWGFGLVSGHGAESVAPGRESTAAGTLHETQPRLPDDMAGPHFPAPIASWPWAEAAVILFAAAWGGILGSFINVVAHRVPRGESLVTAGSRCPSCATPIRPGDNVPVFGWLRLQGRCRACGERFRPSIRWWRPAAGSSWRCSPRPSCRRRPLAARLRRRLSRRHRPTAPGRLAAAAGLRPPCRRDPDGHRLGPARPRRLEATGTPSADSLGRDSRFGRSFAGDCAPRGIQLRLARRGDRGGGRLDLGPVVCDLGNQAGPAAAGKCRRLGGRDGRGGCDGCRDSSSDGTPLAAAGDAGLFLPIVATLWIAFGRIGWPSARLWGPGSPAP